MSRLWRVHPDSKLREKGKKMEFIAAIHDFVGVIDSWLWGMPLIVVLVGTHVYMTVRTHGIQRKVFTGIRLSLAKDPDAAGNVSQFGALTTALSATIGTGNIVGVATAIVSGGVGAIFWMWIIGVFGIATKYAETLISVKYRVRDHAGDMLGGAMYALERGFEGRRWAKIVAVLFALFAALASFGIGGIAQSNSVIGIVQHYADPGGSNMVLSIVLGIVLVVAVGAVIIGGIRGIASVCEKVVPFMAFFYVVGCLIIIAMNGAYFLDAVKWIMVCAFTPQAMVGGGTGFAVATALRFGAARGLFSNESGMGSAPLAAANATTRNPARQSLVSMTGTFWDTVVICAVTGMTLTSSILANPDISAMYQATNALAVGDQTTLTAMAATYGADSVLLGGFAKGLQLTTAVFDQIPVLGPIVLVGGMIMFSYTTLLGWSWYGNRVVAYLFGKKGIRPYQVVFLCFVFFGALGAVGTGVGPALTSLAWDFSDVMNGLMVVPNVVAIWALASVITRDTNHYVWDGNLEERDEAGIPQLDDK